MNFIDIMYWIILVVFAVLGVGGYGNPNWGRFTYWPAIVLLGIIGLVLFTGGGGIHLVH